LLRNVIGNLIFLFVLLIATEGAACKYNVRDVGFVDFGTDVYRLYGYVSDDADSDFQEHLKDLSETIFADSNVQFELISDEGGTDPQAAELLTQLRIEAFPTAVLSMKEREPLIIPMMTDREQVAATFKGLVSSPLRETLQKKLRDVYALVLFVHGTDTEKNDQSRNVVQSAISQITQVMGAMPKASGNPPELLELPLAQREQERILLWSLGIDPVDSHPVAVILYGRGRMLGQALKGLDISERKLDQYLSIIGLDCECGLDRRWMTGRRVPLTWDQHTQHQVAQALEFDPENPMVKMEISRILMKGPNPDVAFDLNQLSSSRFGYQEIEISLTPPEPAPNIESEALPDEPVEPHQTTAEPELPDDPLPAAQNTEQPSLTRSTAIALSIIAALVVVVGLFIALRKNKRG
jgi:hypothetical protein